MLGGKYRVERVLGTGGMGVVLVATHLQLREKVALKVLDADAATDAAAVTRFMREARAAARVKSEHVVRILDFGTFEGGEPYIVMELLEGQDLRSVLEENGRLPVAVAVEYMLQVCKGLSAVHAERIIHRDLKPANLFLTSGSNGAPVVKVLDFGIAKALEPERLALAGAENQTLTQAAQLLGSPLYISPEQIRSSTTVDERTDVWSLGVILHELVTGSTPFRAATVAGLLAAISADAPLSVRASVPDAPVQLEQAIAGCLEKDIERRIPSVDALAERLTRAMRGRRVRPRALTLAVAACVLSAALFVWIEWGHRASTEAPSAEPASAHELSTVSPAARLPVATGLPVAATETAMVALPAPSPQPPASSPIAPASKPRKPARKKASPDYEASAIERRK